MERVNLLEQELMSIDSRIAELLFFIGTTTHIEARAAAAVEHQTLVEKFELCEREYVEALSALQRERQGEASEEAAAILAVLMLEEAERERLDHEYAMSLA